MRGKIGDYKVRDMVKVKDKLEVDMDALIGIIDDSSHYPEYPILFGNEDDVHWALNPDQALGIGIALIRLALKVKDDAS